MRAVQDSNDVAFRALRSGAGAGAALDFCQDVITVHGVLYGITRDKDVAIELRHRSIGHDKAVAIVMEDQAALNLIEICEGALGLRCLIGTPRLAGGITILLAAWEAVAAARQFLDGMAFLKFREHFEERAGIGLFQMQALSDLASRGGVARNLQKTQYIIGTEVWRARHEIRRRRGRLFSTVILATFFGSSGTFFRIPGLYRQANTRPASHPPSDWLGSP